jgi:CRP-like cAMP-binding protein
MRSFDALADGQELVIVTDHEARPLHIEFERTRRSLYVWTQRRLGDRHWEVTLRKMLPTLDGPASSMERSPIFSQGDAASITALAPLGRRVAIKRDRAVAEQGIFWHYVGVVETGIVQAVLATDSGREQVLFDVLPGEVFGEAALIDRGPTMVRFIAQTAGTVVLLLPIEAVRRRIDLDAALFRALSDLNVQRLRAILDRFALLLAEPAMARLAAVLLSYALPAEGLTPALEPLPTMTQPELARLAGTVKEIVQRLLRKLETEGAIRRDGGRIIEVDRMRLGRFTSS